MERNLREGLERNAMMMMRSLKFTGILILTNYFCYSLAYWKRDLVDGTKYWDSSLPGRLPPELNEGDSSMDGVESGLAPWERCWFHMRSCPVPPLIVWIRRWESLIFILESQPNFPFPFPLALALALAFSLFGNVLKPLKGEWNDSAKYF